MISARLLLDSTAEGIYGIDHQGICTFCNAACVRILGYDNADQIIRRNMHDLIHYSRGDGTSVPATECQLLKGLDRQIHSDREVFWRADGSSFPVEYWSYPIQQDDKSIGMVVSFVDIAERKKADKALEEMQELRDRAEAIAHVGSWKLDLATDHLTWSDEVYRIFGCDPQSFPATYETFLNFIHPADRTAVATAYADSLREESDIYEIEHRIIRQDNGEVRYVYEQGVHKYDAMGAVIQSFGMVQDITKRKQMEDTLRLQAQRAEALLELPRLADEYDEKSFMQRAQEVAEDLTSSKIAFIHFINDGGHDIELASWSRRTLEHYCTAAYESHYPVSNAGIWADALREGKPVIFNDYPNYAHKKGLPEGHSMLQRLITVPVIENGQVVMLAGVGNKDTDYSDCDSESVQLIASAIWQIVKKIRMAKISQEAMERIERLARHVPGALYQFQLRPDGSSCFPYASWGIQNIYGVLPGQVVVDAKAAFRALHPEDLARVNVSIQESARTLSTWNDQYRVNLPDGRTIWVGGESTPEVQSDGSVLWHGYIRDITEQKQAEEAIRKSEGLLRDIVESTYSGFWDWNLADNTEYLSPSFKQMFGYEDHEMENSPEAWQKIIFPEDLPGVFEMFDRHVKSRGRESYYGEVRFRHKDGSTVWVICAGKIVEWAMDGTPIRMAGCHFDITKRKQAEEALRESEERFKVLHNASFGGIAIHDQGVILDCNQGLSEISGFGHDELIGMDALLLIAEQSRETVMAHIRSGGEKPYEVLGLRKNGQEYPLRLEAKNIPYDGKRGRVVEFRDITVRKQAEQALRESEIKYRTLFESMIEQVHLWELVRDKQGNIKTWRLVDANPSSLESWKKTRAQTIGKTADEIWPNTNVIELFMPIVKKIVEEGTPHRWESYFEETNQTLAMTSVAYGEYFFSTGLDITERKQFQLSLQQKNEEMEQLVYSVSHDLKSPLVTVKTFAGMLRQDLQNADQPQINEDLNYIDKAADKMGQLLDALLRYSRIGRIDTPEQTVSVDQQVQNCLTTLAGILQSQQVQVSIGQLPQLLHGDPLHFGQIWQNLIENAVKYRGDQAHPHIEIGATQRGHDVVFYVRDNGMGIEPKHNERIFNLFSQLHSGSDGSGLGLALVKKIVSIYRGRIWVESEGSGRGSCFYFTLPEAVLKEDTAA